MARFLSSTSIFALTLGVSGAASAAMLDVAEEPLELDPGINYEVIGQESLGPGQQLVLFAIDFATDLNGFASPFGVDNYIDWNSAAVDRESWASFLVGIPGNEPLSLGSFFGTFDETFGEENDYAAVFWFDQLLDPEFGGLGPITRDTVAINNSITKTGVGGFGVRFGLPASTPVFGCNTVQNPTVGSCITADVPAPPAITIFWAGLMGLGAALARRRREDG
ncbi:MAG: MYXO-CTERM sorting domain-containing protein [Sphingomonadales bacterium]|nr:MYXO-CTERM sorting domain-containing protein [Sphingomonadales bacterium]